MNAATSTSKPTSNPRFVAAREALHERRREEASRAFDLMVDFLKLRHGEVTGKEMAHLFRSWGMVYPGREYPLAREKAGVPLRKAIQRGRPRGHDSALATAWRELVLTTPEVRRPRMVEPTSKNAKALVAQHEAPVVQREAPGRPVILGADAKVGADLALVPTRDLIAELERRREEAKAILDLLGK